MILSGHCWMNSNGHCSWIVIFPLAFLEYCSLHSDWYCGMKPIEASEEAGEFFSTDSNCSDWRINRWPRSRSSLLDFLRIWMESREVWDLFLWAIAVWEVMAFWIGEGNSCESFQWFLWTWSYPTILPEIPCLTGYYWWCISTCWSSEFYTWLSCGEWLETGNHDQ